MLKINVKIDNIPLPISIESQDDKFSIRANYSNEKTTTNKKGKIKFKVSFLMPQTKSYGRFSVFIAEPTFNPIINFRYDERNMGHVTPITFFVGTEPCDPSYISRIHLLTKLVSK